MINRQTARNCPGLTEIAVRDLLKCLSGTYRNHCPGLTETRSGEARVTDLFMPGPTLVTLRGGEGITLSHVDLLVRSGHAEQVQRDVIGVATRLADAFDFRLFVYNETEFAFTLPQARALEFVLKQTQGGAPDQHHTEILNAVGSSCQRLSSLFSRKPYWTRLMKKTSGRRGWYYLDPDFVVWHGATG